MARLLAGLLLAQGVSSAQAQDGIWTQQARTAIEFLNRKWGEPGNWEGVGGWQRFVIVDALIEHERRTGDTSFDKTIDAAVRNRSGLDLNDDHLWAVIATVHAWERDRDPELLAYATSTYRKIVTTYWDDHCGGGLWWDPARSYKNAIANELLIYASTQLFLATGQDNYRQWALRGWSWLQRSSMIDENGLVNDGLDGECRNNGQPRFTYNQGVLLGGLSDLTRITGDPQYRALAVRTALAATRGLSTPEGILREPVPSIGADGLMFKGVFAYHLGHLLQDMAPGVERTELLGWVQFNAGAVWRLSPSGTRPIDSDWTGQTSQFGAAAQASGIDMLLAAGG